jgi:hypothetical protein
MKCWNGWHAWSNENFIGEFVKDLTQADVSLIKWRFDKRGIFTDLGQLKTKVVDAMKGNKAAFNNVINTTDGAKMKQAFDNATTVTDAVIDAFIVKHFDKIFKY